MNKEKTSGSAYLLIKGNQVYYLEKEETTIGRSSTSDVVISDQRVSRKHAKISLVNERYLLTDLNSSGGSYVNGKPVVQKLLEAGDVLTLAFGLKMVFGVDASMIPEDAIPYVAEDVLDGAGVTAELDEDTIEEPVSGDE